MTYQWVHNLRVLKMRIAPTVTRCPEIDLGILYDVEAFK